MMAPQGLRKKKGSDCLAPQLQQVMQQAQLHPGVVSFLLLLEAIYDKESHFIFFLIFTRLMIFVKMNWTVLVKKA